MNNHIFADSYQAKEDGELVWRIRCDFCDACTINGVPTHEHGCPMAWRDELRGCPECGMKFYPEEHNQVFCCDSCRYAYMGLSDPNDDPPEGMIICRDCGHICEPYEPGEEFCSERCAKDYWG